MEKQNIYLILSDFDLYTYKHIIMKQIHCLLILVLALITSCSEEPKPSALEKMLKEEANKEVPSEPQSVSLNDIFENEYERNETLEFEGYIGEVPSTVSMTGGKMSIRIFKHRHQTVGSFVSVDLPIGRDPNHVKSLPAKYQQSDLHVFADDRTQLGVGDKVKITANDFYSSTNYFSLNGLKIEKVDDVFDESIFKDAVALTSDLVNDTAVKEIYGYMDGVLSIPRVFYSMDNYISLSFSSSTNTDFDKVDIRVGSGPSSMNTLPSNYSPKDLVVRDFMGTEVKAQKKVRVYGTWKRYTFVTSSGPGGQYKVEEIVVL